MIVRYGVWDRDGLPFALTIGHMLELVDKIGGRRKHLMAGVKVVFSEQVSSILNICKYTFQRS